jgi:hypothetical protein
MRLLQEMYTDEAHVIEEGVGTEKKLYVEGIAIQTNIGNKNKRIYPKENVQAEIQRYINESVNGRTAWAELDHPKNPSINADRICARFVSLREDGDNYVGKALITNTPMGNLVKGLLESGGRIGTSTRALGSLRTLSNGLNEVQKDFKMITCGDLVMNPSAPDAYVDSLMEGAEWVFDNATGLWCESQAMQHKKQIINASANSLDEIKLSVFGEFLSAISKH